MTDRQIFAAGERIPPEVLRLEPPNSGVAVFGTAVLVEWEDDEAWVRPLHPLGPEECMARISGYPDVCVGAPTNWMLTPARF